MSEAPAVETDKRERGPVVLAAVSVLWFAATLWTANDLVATAETPELGLGKAVLVLPAVVLGALVAGGATAVAVSLRVRRPRAVVGAATGFVVGAVAGGLLLVGYGTAAALVSVAVTLAVGAALCGALAGIRAPAVLAGGIAGTLAWLAVGLLERAFNGRLFQAFAEGRSPAAQLAAAGRLSLLVALLGGAVAGLVAYLYLRRDRGLSWPAYLAAGATPGLLLLATDAATRLGGGPLVTLAGGREADRIALDYLAANRLSTALVVLFMGAITAIMAFGRGR